MTAQDARQPKQPDVSRVKVVQHLVVSVALFAVPAALIADHQIAGGWLLAPYWIVQAVGLLGFSNGAHESVHGHLFGYRRADRWIGRALHLVLLINFEAHRFYHLQHHAFTRLPEDPEGEYDYRHIPTPGSYWLQFLRWCIPPSPLLVLNQRILVGQVQVANPVRRKQLLINELLLVLLVAGLVVAAVAGSPSAVALAYLVPVLVAFPLSAFVTSLPEHFGLPESPSPFVHTRTVTTSPLVSWLLWHFNFHTAHHAQPQTPFHQLPALHVALEPQVEHSTGGYLRFHQDVLHTVRKKRSARQRAW